MKFILIFIPIFVFFMIVFRLKDKWYNRDKNELEERILQLEIRIEDLKKDKIKCHNWMLNELNERLNETTKLDLRLQKIERKKKSMKY